MTVTDNNGATAVSTTSVQIINAPAIRISGIAFNGVIDGATIVVKDESGTQVAQAVSDATGEFNMSVETDQSIDSCYTISATGGTIVGKDFTDTLSATYCDSFPNREQVNVTAVTTLVDSLADVSNAATVKAAHLLARQQLAEIGMISDDNDWSALDTDFVNYGFLTVELDVIGGVEQWIESIIDDLKDQQLSSARVRNLFNRAHGGITEITTADTSLFEGQLRNISVGVVLSDETLPVPTTFSLLNAPSWLTLENNILRIEPSPDTEPGVYNYQVSASPESGATARVNTFDVEVLDAVVILDGTLDFNGGTISNDTQDIQLTAPSGALSRPYSVIYRASLNEMGELITNLFTTPQMPNTEIAQLSITLPSSDVIVESYLQSLESTAYYRINNNVIETARASTSLIVKKPNNDSSLTTTCGGTWQDRNGDGFSFDSVWHCWDGSFYAADLLGDILNSPRGNIPYTYTPLTENRFNIRNRKAFVLRSNIPKEEAGDNEGIPVLFVHGFIGSGDLGGFTSVDDLTQINGEPDSSGEYFGAFPNLVANYSVDDEFTFNPFLFQWRTNVPFQVGAHYLGEAIREIGQTTGKKVHIVAHSFGGVLARTLVQGLAQNELGAIPTTFNRDFAEEYIASLTTLGSPHSGVFPDEVLDLKKKVTFNGDTYTFPDGTDGAAGAAIRLCEAITCHQMGGNTQDLLERREERCGGDCSNLIDGKDQWFGMHEKKGFIAHQLRSKLDIDGWPDVKTQVLIGLVGNINSSDLTRATATSVKGDKLISVAGQRFHAADIDESNEYKELIRDSNITRFSGQQNIVEHFLGFQEFNERFESDNYSLFRDFTDYYLNELSGDVFFNFSNQISLNVPSNEVMTQRRLISGYTHRTSEYKNENIDLDGIATASQVGLQECEAVSPENCRHNTWQYFTSFLENQTLGDTVAQEMPPEEPAPPAPIPELPPNYVQFLEGNPGIEDDGRVIPTSPISLLNSSVTLEPNVAVGTLENGVIITVVTELSSNASFAQVEFEFGYFGSDCLYTANDNNNINDSRTNFEAAYYSPRGLDVLTANARGQSGCENVNVSQMFLNRIEFQRFGGAVLSIDAVIVERGPIIDAPPVAPFGVLTLTSPGQQIISFVPTDAFGAGDFIGQWNGPSSSFMQVSLSTITGSSVISFRPDLSIGTLICVDSNGTLAPSACTGVVLDSGTRTVTFTNLRMGVPPLGDRIYTINGTLIF